MDAPKHTCMSLNGIKVMFPFQPYKTQIDYMTNVVQALQKGHHAMLESPTGTGKTLSLLCSSLAWSQGTCAKSIIYYSSRTHMQLSQAARELKQTAYSKVPSVVIGSRKQMCLDPDVSQTPDHLINRACRNAIAKNACSYYNNYEQKIESMDVNKVYDIEDLYKFGREHMCCPYYSSKKIAETKASLVFMPYNYLADESIRKSVQLRMENSVIIFDEAHNIDGVFKDSVSGSFRLTCLETVRQSCQKLPSALSDALQRTNFGLTRAGFMGEDDKEPETKSKSKKKEKEPKKNPIEELQVNLTNERLQQVNRCAEMLQKEVSALDVKKTITMDMLSHIMKMSGIQYSTSDHVLTTLDSMASFWSIAGVMSPVQVAKFVSATTNLSKVISLLYPRNCLSVARQAKHDKKLLEYFWVHMEVFRDEVQVLREGPPKDWELHIWCLHPAQGLKRMLDDCSINGPRSLIFTSGTLAPMPAMEKELDLDIIARDAQKSVIKKEFEHVITPEQFRIMIVAKSLNGYSLDSTFKSSVKTEYIEALGQAIKAAIQVLPHGTLIFSPSYSHMDRILKYWESKPGFMRELRAISAIYSEKKDRDIFMADLESYKRHIDTQQNGPTKGRAVYFGVCRGKLSEGTNLKDNHCRTVILLGLPFPNIKDPKIVATKDFQRRVQQSRGTSNMMLDAGQTWLSQQMTRALNQTIGRVIRSKNDFGLLILMDPRFTQYKYSLSSWASRLYPSKETDFNEMTAIVKEFFAHHGIRINASITEGIGAFEFELPKAKSKPPPPPPPAIARSNPQFLNSIRSVHASTPRPINVRGDSQISVSNVCLQQPSQARSQSQFQSQSQSVSNSSFSSSNGINSQPNVSQNTSHLSSLARIGLAVCKSPNTSCETDSQPIDFECFNQFRQKRPNPYLCSICKWKANTPHRTGCDCARVGCLRCLMPLCGKDCAKCKKPIVRKDFKPLLFKSAFQTKQQAPMTTISPAKKKIKSSSKEAS